MDDVDTTIQRSHVFGKFNLGWFGSLGITCCLLILLLEVLRSSVLSLLLFGTNELDNDRVRPTP